MKVLLLVLMLSGSCFAQQCANGVCTVQRTSVRSASVTNAISVPRPLRWLRNRRRDSSSSYSVVMTAPVEASCGQEAVLAPVPVPTVIR